MPNFSNMGTVGEIIERNFRLRPNAPALSYAGKSYSYREFTENAFRLANALYDQGLRRQNRIAILAQNSDAYLEVYAACEIAGFIIVTINYRLAPAEMAFILKDSAPSVLVFDPDYAEIVEKLRPEFVDLRLISLGRPINAGATVYTDFVERCSTLPPPIKSIPGDIAYLVYTSGTTGRPKGTMLSQRAMALSAEVHAQEKKLSNAERILAVMPLYHVGAKYTQLSAMAGGAELVLHRSYDVRALARDFQDKHINVVHLAPIMVQDLLNLPDLKNYDHASLRLINYASGPMSVTLLEKAIATYGPIFMQHYGMTESGATTALLPEDHIVEGAPEAVRRLASAGRPGAGTRIKIVRPDGVECEEGAQGEILLLSQMNMLGYWNNNAATMDALDEDHWLHSGDIGFIDNEGYLFVSDRKKDLIISGGENIYPREVEEAIYRHAAVSEVAVIGVPDERWGESVKAYVVLKPHSSSSESEIIEHCRAHIASYKKPKAVEFVQTLPRLANHKIDKKELRKNSWVGIQRQVN